VIFGLGAALGWGLSDLWAAMSGRRIGSFRTVVIAQIAAAVAMSLLVLAIGPDLSGLSQVVPWLIPNAFFAALGFATLYRGLELGPIAVVSPVLATYAVIPVLLSVVLLGESLGAVAVAGVTITIAGAVLTSTDVRALRAGTHTRPAGLQWAVVSTLAFGVATYIMGWAAQQAGVLSSLWLGKLSMAVVLVGLRPPGEGPVGSRSTAVGRPALNGDRGGSRGAPGHGLVRPRRRGGAGLDRDSRLGHLSADPGPGRRGAVPRTARPDPIRRRRDGDRRVGRPGLRVSPRRAQPRPWR
jgi:uncharacterized membrane protein